MRLNPERRHLPEGSSRRRPANYLSPPFTHVLSDPQLKLCVCLWSLKHPLSWVN